MSRLILRLTAYVLALTLVASACASDAPLADPIPAVASTSIPTPTPVETPTAATPSTPSATTEPAPTATAAPTSAPTATAAPTSAPVDASPTPPSHPWYECEFFDYALAGVDYRVTNIEDRDPDGGLVAHVSPGIDAPVTEILAQNTGELGVSGCQQEFTNESVWWLVEDRGWVNASYLEAYSPFGAEHWRPGMTNPLPASALPAVTGIEAEDWPSLAQAIRDDVAREDFTTVELGNFQGVDARGGIAQLDIAGLGDDSVGGFRLALTIDLIKDANANEILGYRIVSVVGRAICIRGVTADGAVCV